MPAGTGAGAREELRGGRSATRVPERGRETTTPRRRSSARADATVVGDTSSSLASARTDGSRAPGASVPAATARSTDAAMASADDPDMTYCADTEL